MVNYITHTRHLKDTDEVSIVFTVKVGVNETKNGENYIDVGKTMHTPFEGPRARERAEIFKRSEETRDFTPAKGWVWFIWSTPKANEEYGKAMTRAMLGED